MPAAFTKCFSQSNRRHITSGTTGLQRVTESEFFQIQFLLYWALWPYSAFVKICSSASSFASAPRCLCWRTHWCAFWSSGCHVICPWAQPMPWSSQITWSRGLLEFSPMVCEDSLVGCNCLWSPVKMCMLVSGGIYDEQPNYVFQGATASSCFFLRMIEKYLVCVVFVIHSNWLFLFKQTWRSWKWRGSNSLMQCSICVHTTTQRTFSCLQGTGFTGF